MLEKPFGEEDTLFIRPEPGQNTHIQWGISVGTIFLEIPSRGGEGKQRSPSYPCTHVCATEARNRLCTGGSRPDAWYQKINRILLAASKNLSKQFFDPSSSGQLYASRVPMLNAEGGGRAGGNHSKIECFHHDG